MKNYYRILECDQNSSLDNIKKAYRKLALKFHPDKNKNFNAASKFIEITEAYEVLRDPEKRSVYDKIYKQYYQENKTVVTETKEYQRNKNNWEKYGQEKAEVYSNLDFEEFLKRSILEIKIGANYLPNVITILFIGFGILGFIFMAFNSMEDDNGSFIGLALIIIPILGILIYHLYKVMAADYREERKRKIRK